MYELTTPAGALVLLGLAVMRWRAHDASAGGELSTGALGFTGLWLWLHAWLVALTATEGIGRVGDLVPGVVVGGAVIALAGTGWVAWLVRRFGWRRLLATGGPGDVVAGRVRAKLGWAVLLAGVALAGQSLGAVALGLPVAVALAVSARGERRDAARTWRRLPERPAGAGTSRKGNGARSIG